MKNRKFEFEQTTHDNQIAEKDKVIAQLSKKVDGFEQSKELY